MNPVRTMWTAGRFIARGMGVLLALALLFGTTVLAAEAQAATTHKAPKTPAPQPPAAPSVAEPSEPPEPPDSDIPLPPRPKKSGGDKSNPRYILEEGSTNQGDLYLFKDAVVIRGKQDGDLIVFGRELEVAKDGIVTGDINAFTQSVDLSGKMGDSVRAMAQSVHLTGTINGDLVAVGESIVVDKGARITGDLDAKGARVQMDGTVDGDFTATGGEVHLLGKVGGSAELKGDVIEVDPRAKVHGDLTYTSRNKIEEDAHQVVDGEVVYTPNRSKPKVSSHGFIKWFFFTATALLAGLVSLAMFRRSAPEVVAAVRSDGLRSAGVGFISAIVIPVALAIACILIITIPAVVLGYIAYFMLLYLAQVPVGVFVGEWLLQRLGKTAGPFAAVALGIPVMYVVFAIPVLGKLALFMVVFTGFGAIVMTIWTAR
ncbi:MAG TPA: polymer-forming cytoskeletal protein, partial [Candidatus Polarisedimenticolia bacterium]|nr:polymer-forming cytoskeletal protein [Candidatus Polarisedimenticolia bacterium]